MNLIDVYNSKIAGGELRVDLAQGLAIGKLAGLVAGLADGSAERGIYLFGPVGRGKSMLMEMFLGCVSVPKRRVHFHGFMEELHAKMHSIKGGDPLEIIAGEVAGTCKLLCFDEFYITNIADAMLLGRLFEKFFAHGIVVVATSNWPPAELFQGGVNRDRFMPFINSIMRHMEAVEVAGDKDYRDSGGDLPLYFVGGDSGCLDRFKGARFEFEDLCGDGMGREFYLDLVKENDCVVLGGIPIFTANDTDKAIRFITLVDILYEAKVPLVCMAEALPSELCLAGDASGAFLRTVSRLMEMQFWFLRSEV